jgi:hypothetical protein
MLHRTLLITSMLLAVVSAGVPARASGADPAGLASLERRIERAQVRVEQWYGRIERWYERIDQVSIRVERLEEALARDPADGSATGLRHSTPRRLHPSYVLAEARRVLRRVLTDRRAQRVQSELETWSAYLAELVQARERALRPAPVVDAAGDAAGDGRLLPEGPVTYEGWAGAFLRRLEAPACQENLLVVVTWQTAESTEAAFNPLATTRDMPGATELNSVGVKHYVSLRQGLDASRDTLLLGAESYGYGAIVDSFRRCAAAGATARAINASAWCRGCVAGAYMTGLVPIVASSYEEHAARLVATPS